MTGFSKGDVVQLKSGGDPMCVVRIIGEEGSSNEAWMADKLYKAKGRSDGYVVCEWREGGRQCEDAFCPTSLERAD